MKYQEILENRKKYLEILGNNLKYQEIPRKIVIYFYVFQFLEILTIFFIISYPSVQMKSEMVSMFLAIHPAITN
jgi:hypothetical protein